MISYDDDDDFDDDTHSDFEYTTFEEGFATWEVNYSS